MYIIDIIHECISFKKKTVLVGGLCYLRTSCYQATLISVLSILFPNVSHYLEKVITFLLCYNPNNASATGQSKMSHLLKSYCFVYSFIEGNRTQLLRKIVKNAHCNFSDHKLMCSNCFILSNRQPETQRLFIYNHKSLHLRSFNH